MKRRWIIILVVLGVSAVGLFVRQKISVQSADASKIQTVNVLRKDFVKDVRSSGKTKAGKSVQLKFQTSGRLAWVGVKEGDSVRAYQALAGMDQREVQKSLEKSLRDYSKDRNDFEETWRVTYKGIQNPSTALTDTVKRILEKNQWDLDLAVLDVELKHLAVEYATLVTPIAGVITHIDTPISGVNITPAASVFEVVDPTTIVFEAKIDEVDIGLLSIGQEAIVTLDAFPDTPFHATISSIAYAAESSGGGATVFPVQLTIADTTNLRVGFNGDVAIIAKKVLQTLVVPISAIREEGKTKYIYNKTGTEYTKIPITVIMSSDDEAVVSGALQEGDEIVIKGFAQIPAKKL